MGELEIEGRGGERGAMGKRVWNGMGWGRVW